MYGEAELEINQETREKNYGETKLESGKEEVREKNMEKLEKILA